MQINTRTAMSTTAVLQHLQELEELHPVQQETLEYLSRNVAVEDMGTFEELVEELTAMDSFREEHILKIIETLPRSEQEVRTLFSKERIKLDDGEIEDIVSFVESIDAR